MLEFLESDSNNVKMLAPYFARAQGRLSDMSIGSRFMWRKNEGMSFAFINDTLIVKIDYEKGKTAFMYPIGDDEGAALSAIESYVKERDQALEFGLIPNETLPKLQQRYQKGLKITALRDWSDYLYTTESLGSFSGKKYNGQRNHLNKFKKLYPDYIFKHAVSADIPRLQKFFDKYQEEKKPNGEIAEKESANARELILYFEALGLPAAYIEVKGEIVAFSIGEIVKDTLIIHVEKALRSYEGAYPAMVTLFVQNCGIGTAYVNREDDSGDLGLRKSKLQYHPMALLEKNFVEVFFPREIAFDVIETERLTISEILPGDKETYCRLAVNDARNRYWGYDYREDLEEGQVADQDFFYNIIKKDIEERRSYSLKIALKGSTKLIGEIVIYDFFISGTGELGCRIMGEYAGKGYGREAYTAMTLWAKSRGIALRARCYKENAPSIKMIESAGYRLIREDSKMYYFVQ